MFGTSFLATGKGVMIFQVLRRSPQKSSGGRVLLGELEELGEIRGSLAKSRGTVENQNKQVTHPVSHVIIVKGVPEIALQVGDVLRHGGRDFILNTIPYDVGALGHWTELYCEERRDLI
ncbi:MAG: hypothetical protein R3Y63_08985 [Eubacteriales bacterium]